MGGKELTLTTGNDLLVAKDINSWLVVSGRFEMPKRREVLDSTDPTS